MVLDILFVDLRFKPDDLPIPLELWRLHNVVSSMVMCFSNMAMQNLWVARTSVLEVRGSFYAGQRE